MNSGSSPKKACYRLKRATLLRRLGILVFFWFFLGISGVVLWIETIAFFRAENPDPFIFVLARMMLVVALLLSFTFLLVNIMTVLDLFSYIRVTSEGIEQRRSPFRYVKGTWAEVEKFGKVQLIYDIILLKSPARTGKSVEVSTHLNFLLPKQPFIVLTGFDGWPEGALKDDLEKYAPGLSQASFDSKKS